MTICQGKRSVVIFGLAFLLSALGYEFMVFVMTVLIYDLTGSAMDVGLFTALTFLPRLFSPYYGSLADRYPRGRIFSVAAMGIALGVFLWRLCLSCQLPLFVVYVKQFLGKGSDGYGIFMSMAGMGSVLGSVLGPRLAVKFDRKKLLVWGLAAHYVSFACLGVTRSFGASLVLVAVSFACFYATIVSTHSLRDQATPIEYRGRVYGSIVAILTPAALVSFLAGSYLAGVFGVEKVLIGAGGVALVTLAALQVTQCSPVPTSSGRPTRMEEFPD